MWPDVLMVVTLLAFYLPTLAPGVTFSDGPEIAAAIVTLGVIHPTGYPIFTLVAHAFLALVPTPFEPCVEIELLNALFGVAAAACVAKAVRTLSVAILVQADPVEAERRDRHARWAGAFAGLGLGIAPLLWNQVRIPEVYALHVCLVAWAVARFARYELTRNPVDIVWTAVPMGLGLAHHVTIVYMLPAAAVYLIVRRPSFFWGWAFEPFVVLARRWRGNPHLGLALAPPRSYLFLVGCLVGASPLLSYGYLWWASLHTTGIPWGGIHDFSSLVSHVSGDQYRGYMKGLEYADLPNRVASLPGYLFTQIEIVATVLAGLGMGLLAWRAWPFLLFLVTFALAVSGHGVQYGVGDYRNYFLPVLVVLAVLCGIGATKASLAAHRERRLRRRTHAALCLGLGAFGVAIAIVDATSPAIFESHLDETWRKAAASTWGLLCAAGALWPWRPGVASSSAQGVTPRIPWRLGWALAVAFTLALGFARSQKIGSSALVGRAHAASVAREVPTGAIYLTATDGFLFSQWYQQHALHDGIDEAVVNVRGLQRHWYREGYLKTRYPKVCDPLYGPYAASPADYDAHCGTFERRIALPKGEAWLKLSTGTFRSGGQPLALPKADPAGTRSDRTATPTGDTDTHAAHTDTHAAHTDATDTDTDTTDTTDTDATDTSAPRLIGTPLSAADLRRLRGAVVRGHDDDCESAAVRLKKPHACRCYEVGLRPYRHDEWCVPSFEEGGIVPRMTEEIFAHRLIQDHLDERPVFERNVFTRWAAKGQNKRRWDGPMYLRPSGEYTLVNRGRTQEVVYSRDVQSHPTCDADTLVRVPTPTRLGPSPRTVPNPNRPPYQPSDWPVLLTHSFLTVAPDDSGDKARVVFRAGDTIDLHLHWFERWHYDASRQNRRGKPLLHGVRVCAFDPLGRKVWFSEVRSGHTATNVLHFTTSPEAAPGTYVVQACSVGELASRTEAFGDRACVRPILEYELEVTERPHP